MLLNNLYKIGSEFLAYKLLWATTRELGDILGYPLPRDVDDALERLPWIGRFWNQVAGAEPNLVDLI